jgi:hypothetical protein
MQSHDGLIDTESDGEGSKADSSPVDPSAQGKVNVQRARSVNLSGHHVRSFSAGSAKLLDITHRTSVDYKAQGAVNNRRGSTHI